MSAVQEVGGFGNFMSVLGEESGASDSLLIINRERGSFEQFANAVREAEGGAFDFDATLHPGNHWSHIRDYMTPEHRAENEAALASYLGRHDRTDRDDLDFLLDTVRAMVESGMRKSHLDQAAEKVDVRTGAVSLVHSFGGQAKVVSYGCYDVIRLWCVRHGLTSASIGAIRLRISAGGEVYGADFTTAVSDGNKGYMVDALAANYQISAEKMFVVGDSPTDAKMFRPGNIGVLIIPKFDPENDRHVYRMRGLQAMWPNVWCVLAGDSLKPLADLRR